MIPIPYFRAKKIDSDEYNCGYLIRADDYEADADEDQIVYFIMHKMENYRTNEVWDFVCNSRIDPSTLAIHFPDILDSQGNKIFASLQEDGKGGDLIDNFNFQEKYRIQTAIYKYNCFHLMDKDNDTYSLIECKLQKGIKVIGVKE